MAQVRLEDQYGVQHAVIDLGDADDGGYYEPDNIYIHVDGKEYGSLWFHRGEDGGITVTLGQFDAGEEQWVARNPMGPISL